MDSFERELEEWLSAMLRKGHNPIMDPGYEDGTRIDVFVFDSGIHNGPGCKDCGWSCCRHCNKIEDIPQCSSMKMIEP